MLETLTIKDFALIDYINVEFKNGFTVLSGETGAGKSILIGAISFLLGGKADVSLIRTGTHEANVSGIFFLNKDALSVRKNFSPDSDEEALTAGEWLLRHGIEADGDAILLRRYIRDTGRSAGWIGNVAVTRSDLTEFSAFLIDIHGQHEHQSLMKVSEHRKFLDARAGIVSEVENFTSLYSELVSTRKNIAALFSNEKERAEKLELFSYALNEINEAKLKADEDVLLEDEESKLSSYEKLSAEIESINEALSDSENSVVPLLKKIRRDVSHAAEMDKSLSPLDDRLEASFYEISDIAAEFSSYASKLVFDPARFAEVQDRLSLIYGLKKKYASSPNAPLSEVLAYAEEAQKNIELLQGGSQNKDQLEKRAAELEKQVYAEARKLSEKRKAAAVQMSREVESILQKLGMAGTKFAVRIAEKPGNALEQKCGPYGMDNVEFLIAANVGGNLLPLAQIASGGELSRVMLALKTVFASTDSVDTLIFDEIDTGIGGEVAVAVGSHLKNLSKNRQILCITHLASIAVYADNQIKIEKGVSEGKTSSRLREIDGENRVLEIARMLSGDADSSQSLDHARSLLQKYGGI